MTVYKAYLSESLLERLPQLSLRHRRRHRLSETETDDPMTKMQRPFGSSPAGADWGINWKAPQKRWWSRFERSIGWEGRPCELSNKFELSNK